MSRSFLFAVLIGLFAARTATACEDDSDCPAGMSCISRTCYGAGLIKSSTPKDDKAKASAARETSRTCKFTDGPRAGQMLYLSPQTYPQVQPFVPGGPCSDGFSSTGIAVTDETLKKKEKAEGKVHLDEAVLSRTCHFTSGPSIGQVKYFSEELYPSLTGFPLGGACTDSDGSRGVAVADSAVAAAYHASGASRTCRFESGPRVGQTQYFSPELFPDFMPMTIGSVCDDGAGSGGRAIVDRDISESENPADTGFTRRCQIRAGPRIGQILVFSPEEYPDMQPLLVGTPCGDGAGSTGVAIPESKNKDALPPSGGLSRTCQFTSGPRVGQTQFYSPQVYPDMAPMAIGTICRDDDGSAGFVVADR